MTEEDVVLMVVTGSVRSAMIEHRERSPGFVEIDGALVEVDYSE
jgi:hypothetical protein